MIRLEARTPWSDHVNVWYVRSSEVSILIDTGPPDSVKELTKALERVNYVLLTHYHPDHVGGLPAIAKMFRPIVIVNPTEYSFIVDERRVRKYVEVVLRRGGVRWNSEMVERIIKRGFPYAQRKDLGVVYRVVRGDIDVMYFNIGVVPCGGHTWGHTCYTIGDGAFVGDSLLKSEVPDISSYVSSESTLSVLRSMNVERFYPGHGDIVGRSFLEHLADDLYNRRMRKLSAVVELAERATSVYEIAVNLYGELRGPLELFLALQEVSAYVKYLSIHRKVRILSEAGGRWIVRKC